MKIQMTLFCTTGKYKPISTLVEAESLEEFKANFAKYKKKALSNICAQRYKDGKNLLDSGYTQMKWRIYDKEERKKQMIAEMIKKIQNKA